jgi:hypothetical protein
MWGAPSLLPAPKDKQIPRLRGPKGRFARDDDARASSVHRRANPPICQSFETWVTVKLPEHRLCPE